MSDTGCGSLPEGSAFVCNFVSLGFTASEDLLPETPSDELPRSNFPLKSLASLAIWRAEINLT